MPTASAGRASTTTSPLTTNVRRPLAELAINRATPRNLNDDAWFDSH
jgi:hypothetical protein